MRLVEVADVAVLGVQNVLAPVADGHDVVPHRDVGPNTPRRYMAEQEPMKLRRQKIAQGVSVLDLRRAIENGLTAAVVPDHLDAVKTHRVLGMAVQEIRLPLQLVRGGPVVVPFHHGHVLPAAGLVGPRDGRAGADIAPIQEHADAIRVFLPVPPNHVPGAVRRAILRNDQLGQGKSVFWVRNPSIACPMKRSWLYVRIRALTFTVWAPMVIWPEPPCASGVPDVPESPDDGSQPVCTRWQMDSTVSGSMLVPVGSEKARFVRASV